MAFGVHIQMPFALTCVRVPVELDEILKAFPAKVTSLINIPDTVVSPGNRVAKLIAMFDVDAASVTVVLRP
jgi:hypothetical protein